MDPNFKVIIIGAGLAGLCLAHGLKKNNIPFSIYEKETTPRDRNWGVTISWAVPFIEKCLPPELFARLKECQPDPSLDCKARGQESVLVRDGASGEVLIEIPFPGIRRLQIGKTRRIWGKDINVHFGKSIRSIDTPESGGVVAHFSDGTSESASVLIGTDGGSSWVRGYLLGEDAESEALPFNFVNFPVKYTAEQAVWLDQQIHPVVDAGCHPKSMYTGLFMLDKPDLTDPGTWVFYFLATWPKEEGVTYSKNDDLLEEYRQRMEGWGQPYKNATDWIPEGTRVSPVMGGLRVFSPKSKWDNKGGRVTIGGDSVHSVTFHRGQGGNNALRDAERYLSAILEVKDGSKTLVEAVDSYDEEVLSRGAAEVEMSSKQTHAFHNYESFLQSPLFKHGVKPTAANLAGASTNT